jgi:hypothetical protein
MCKAAANSAFQLMRVKDFFRLPVLFTELTPKSLIVVREGALASRPFFSVHKSAFSCRTGRIRDRVPVKFKSC